MPIELLPRQRQAVAWLHGRGGRGLLWMDAGTGKTFAALQYLIEETVRGGVAGGQPLGRVLVLCPSVLKDQWASEAKAYCGATVNVVAGSRSERVGQWSKASWLTVANYELLDRDFDVISQVPWLAIVADESHMLKSPTSKRWKLFRKLDPRYRLALSGTPLPNALWEIWTTLEWLHPGCLGSSFYSFRSRHCVMNPFIPGAIVGYRDEEAIHKVLRSLSYRAERDPADLPPLTSRVLDVALSSHERVLYEQLRKECRIVLEGVEKLTVPNVLAQLMRMRQLVDCPATLGLPVDCSKLAALDRLIRERDVKTLVFTEFETVAAAIAARWPGSVVISGSVSSVGRSRALGLFKKDPACRLLVSTSAGQYGLNLQEAERVIHLGVPWNWARTEQRLARSYRHGQTAEVEEVFVLAAGTVDTKMHNLILKKKALSDRLSASEIGQLIYED